MGVLRGEGGCNGERLGEVNKGRGDNKGHTHTHTHKTVTAHTRLSRLTQAQLVEEGCETARCRHAPSSRIAATNTRNRCRARRLASSVHLPRSQKADSFDFIDHQVDPLPLQGRDERRSRVSSRGSDFAGTPIVQARLGLNEAVTRRVCRVRGRGRAWGRARQGEHEWMRSPPG